MGALESSQNPLIGGNDDEKYNQFNGNMNGNGMAGQNALQDMMAGMQVASLIDKASKAVIAKESQQGLDEYNLSDDDDDDEKYNQFNGNGMHQLRLAAKTKAA